MTKVTAKYQITLPPDVRNELSIVPGSEVEIARKGNDYVLVVNPIAELKKTWRGKYRGKQRTDEYIDEIRGRIE